MKHPHRYRMTIATSWYDGTESGKKSYELHFTAERRGNARTVRRTLSKRGLPYFQQAIYRRFKKWIPKWKIRFDSSAKSQLRRAATESLSKVAACSTAARDGDPIHSLREVSAT